MANILLFREQQIGDGIVTIVPAHRPLVPVAHQLGLFHDEAAVASDSRNMLRTLVFEVYLKRDSQVALIAAVSAIQSLQCLDGLLMIQESDLIRMTAEGWRMESVDEPQTAAGFAGRWLPSLVVRFVGGSEPVWF